MNNFKNENVSGLTMNIKIHSEMVWSLWLFPGEDAVTSSTLNIMAVTETERFPGEDILLSVVFSSCPNPC